MMVNLDLCRRAFLLYHHQDYYIHQHHLINRQGDD
jgi:hypothetical protein